jgi:hypothetical protein
MPERERRFERRRNRDRDEHLAGSGSHDLQLLFNLNGIRATGMSSGTIYRVTGVTATTRSFPIASEAGADTYTFAQTWKLVPQSGNGRSAELSRSRRSCFSPDGQLFPLSVNQLGGCDEDGASPAFGGRAGCGRRGSQNLIFQALPRAASLPPGVASRGPPRRRKHRSANTDPLWATVASAGPGAPRRR